MFSSSGIQYGYQPLGTGDSPTFAGVTIGSTTVGGNETINATLGADLSPAYSGASGVNWTLGTGWETPIASSVLNKNADGTGTATPTATTNLTANRFYKVTVTTAVTTGYFSLDFGGVRVSTVIQGTGIYWVYTQTTAKPVITPSDTSRFTVTLAWQLKTNSTGDLTVNGDIKLSNSIMDANGNEILTFPGYRNIAIGLDALLSTTSGFRNIAIGTNTLSVNTTGYDNIGIGENALSSNTTGTTNIGIGADCLSANTTGYSNTAVGRDAMYVNTEGYKNTSLGYQTLYANLTGDENTAVGYKALAAVTTGNNNTGLGDSAGVSLTTGSNNIAVGYNVDLPAVDSSNCLNIGGLIFGTGLYATGAGSVGYKMNDNAATPIVPTGQLKFFAHNKSVADNGIVTLPLVTSAGFGVVIAGTKEEYTTFYVDNDGDVTLVGNSANVVANADTDAKLDIGTAATQEPLIIKNALGATKVLNIVFWYD